MTAILDRLSASLHERYTLERELGQGGMATVYLAVDRRHERHVAIKVLHPELSAVLGAERFLSEIKLTASLQHPHILPLFDSGVADGLVYYVMPFVEGETLRGKLNRERQLSVPDSVRLATEIADALQYAHERGIVHRDIKPENVLLQNGHAIVADFGIALAVQQAGGSRMTQTGMSLGTPQYMAPEQAMAERNVDARADVYALGAVTYELLAGEPPFTGPTAQSIVAKVMTERSRPLRAVRDTVPLNVERAVATALEKLPADRMPTARAFSEALRQEPPAGGEGPGNANSKTTPRSAGVPTRTAIAFALLGVCFGLAVGSVARSLIRSSPRSNTTELPIKFEVNPPDSVRLRLVCCGGLFAISSDGHWLVYQGTPSTPDAAVKNGADHQLYLRDLTDLSVRSLPGTINAQDIFFSPNNEEIGFAAGKQLMRVKLAGGDPQTIATLPEGYNGGGSWSEDGMITFGVSARMVQVPASGGSPVDLFVADAPGLQFMGPQVVLGSHVLLYTTSSLERIPRIMWRSLATGKSHVVARGSTPTYIAAQRALLLVRGDGTLVQYPFDIASGDTTGPAVRIATDVALRSPVVAHAEYTTSANGTLVLATRRAGTLAGGLSLVGLQGATPMVRRILPEYLDFDPPQITPDGSKLAVLVPQTQSELVPFIYDISRGATTRLHVLGVSGSMTLSQNADSILYRVGSSDVYEAAMDGSGEAVHVLQLKGWSMAEPPMSTQGAWIAFSGTTVGSGGIPDIGVASRDSGGKVMSYVASKAGETEPRISPDGRWLAYTTDETGGAQVFVTTFPKASGRYLVTPEGGSTAEWSTDSHTLYFVNGNTVFATSFASGAVGAPPAIGVPRSIYKRDPWASVGISRGGNALAFVDRLREGEPRSLVVRTHAVVEASRYAR